MENNIRVCPYAKIPTVHMQVVSHSTLECLLLPSTCDWWRLKHAQVCHMRAAASQLI